MNCCLVRSILIQNAELHANWTCQIDPQLDERCEALPEGNHSWGSPNNIPTTTSQSRGRDAARIPPPAASPACIRQLAWWRKRRSRISQALKSSFIVGSGFSHDALPRILTKDIRPEGPFDEKPANRCRHRFRSSGLRLRPVVLVTRITWRRNLRFTRRVANPTAPLLVPFVEFNRQTAY